MMMMEMVIMSCIIGIIVFGVAMVRIKTNETLKAINADMNELKKNTEKIHASIVDELDI